VSAPRQATPPAHDALAEAGEAKERHTRVARRQAEATTLHVEPGYWTLAELAAYMRCTRWTVARRAKDAGFPVLHGYGGPRFPIERVKAYLQRQEQRRGRGYKSRGLLSLAPQTTATATDPAAEATS
jgi:hypothetical protein